MATVIEMDSIGTKNKFKPGDFITSSNKPTSFCIFEGVDVSTSSTFKKLSVLVSYDPSKYCESDSGYKMMPFLEVARSNKRCEKTVDTDESCYWTRKCSEVEKEEALRKLLEYGYIWDEENKTLLDSETNEVITKIHLPKLEYKGDIIKPISEKFKEILRMFCRDKNKKVEYSYPNSHYSRYWDMYGEGAYDEYWD